MRAAAPTTKHNHNPPHQPTHTHKHHARTLTALIATTTTLAIALTACGSSNTTSQQTNSQTATTAAHTSTKPHRHVPTVEKVEITSPAVTPDQKLTSNRYTCDGANISLPLQWKGIPPNTTELALDIIKLKPVNNKLFFAWALAGINPKTHHINPGTQPPGSITGLNSNNQTHYNLCPPKHTSEEYVVVLFALPHTLHPKPAYNPTQLRRKAIQTAQYEGFLIFTYTRP